jgi:hypothetical protein
MVPRGGRGSQVARKDDGDKPLYYDAGRGVYGPRRRMWKTRGIRPDAPVREDAGRISGERE